MRFLLHKWRNSFTLRFRLLMTRVLRIWFLLIFARPKITWCIVLFQKHIFFCKSQHFASPNAQIEKAHRMTYKQWLCFERTDWKSLKWFYKKSFWFMASACFISSTRTKIDQGRLAQPGRAWADHAEIGGHPAAQWAKTSKCVQKPVSILNVREIRDFWWKKG